MLGPPVLDSIYLMLQTRITCVISLANQSIEKVSNLYVIKYFKQKPCIAS